MKLNWQKANAKVRAKRQGTEMALTTGQRSQERNKFIAQRRAAQRRKLKHNIR